MSVFNLDKMFHPKSLAVVGASDKQGSIGTAIMQNLQEETLIRLSHLMTDFAEIAELDINPLLVTGNSVCAVDARVILEPSQQPAPLHLSISPYPTQYETHITTKGLVELFIRPIRPEDASLLEELFASLSPRSIYQRFFTPLKSLPHSMLARFTQIDYDREIALVAFHRSRPQDTMLGVARIVLGWDQTQSEFAVLVGDPWQGKGIGAELLKQCLKIAGERNIEKIRGSVLAQNTQMLALGRKLQFNIHKVPGESEFELKLDLQKVAIH